MNETKKKEAEIWFNKLIETREAYIKAAAGTEYSEINVFEQNKIHMRNLDVLADALGLTVTYNPNWDDRYPNRGIITTKYKGYELYELWIKEAEK